MSLKKVTEHLKKYNLENRIMKFVSSSATVKEASKAVGCKEEEIAKTLSFIVDNTPILIVTSGNQKIDNSKFKAEFKTKAKMISLDEVENKIGHSVGGVCPFGVNKDVKVFLDISLKKFNTIYPAAGTSTTAVKLSLEELEKTSNYVKWVDVCKKNTP